MSVPLPRPQRRRDWLDGTYSFGSGAFFVVVPWQAVAVTTEEVEHCFNSHEFWVRLQLQLPPRAAPLFPNDFEIHGHANYLPGGVGVKMGKILLRYLQHAVPAYDPSLIEAWPGTGVALPAPVSADGAVTNLVSHSAESPAPLLYDVSRLLIRRDRTTSMLAHNDHVP